MNLRTYTLSVSLASLIGLLVAIVPIVHHALEYFSPVVSQPTGTPSAEWFSPVATAAQRWKLDDARSAAAHSLIAYGALFVVCEVMLTIHLRWGLRLSREKGTLEEQSSIDHAERAK